MTFTSWMARCQMIQTHQQNHCGLQVRTITLTLGGHPDPYLVPREPLNQQSRSTLNQMAPLINPLRMFHSLPARIKGLTACRMYRIEVGSLKCRLSPNLTSQMLDLVLI